MSTTASSSSAPSTSSVSETPSTPNNTTINGITSYIPDTRNTDAISSNIDESVTKRTTNSSPPLEPSPNKKTITPLSPQQEQPLSHPNAQNPTPSTAGHSGVLMNSMKKKTSDETKQGKIIDKISNSVHSGYSSAGEMNGGEDLCNKEQDEEEDDHGWLAGAATKLKGKKRKRPSQDDSSLSIESDSAIKTTPETNASITCSLTANNTTDMITTNSTSSTSQEKKSSGPAASSTYTETESPKKNTPASEIKAEPSIVPNEDNMVIEEKGERKKLLEDIQKECAEKQIICKRLYQNCKSEIDKMTEENLPRKTKNNGRVRVSVTVPDAKKGGDKITFSNPHVPGQRLMVTVPASVKAGQMFKVSVPMPEVEKAEPQNKFTKCCIVALSEYSNAYDDWCQSEAKQRNLVPQYNPKDGKVVPFKIGVERLKKYDSLLSEFPDDLEVKVDPIYLRLLVRRLKQNEQKRLKTIANAVPSPPKSNVSKSPSLKKATPKKVMIQLEVPVKSTEFSSVMFRAEDFDMIE